MTGRFIPKHGGYKRLLSYQKAEIVFDATVCFCERFIDRRSRTVDQMVQAARSGKQNILEGSVASGTSKETEIKLTSVARQPGGAPSRLPRFPPRTRPPGVAQGARLRSPAPGAEPPARCHLRDLPERH
jgi:hypothetical protein